MPFLLTARDCARIAKIVEHNGTAVLLRLIADLQHVPPKPARLKIPCGFVTTIPISVTDSFGTTAPAGKITSVVISKPNAVTAGIADDGTSVVLNPQVKRAKGIKAEVQTETGKIGSFIFDIAPDARKTEVKLGYKV